MRRERVFESEMSRTCVGAVPNASPVYVPGYVGEERPFEETGTPRTMVPILDMTISHWMH